MTFISSEGCDTMLYQISRGSKSFGVETVFEEIQFEIRGTEKVAIVGRNGCGKSTLLKIMMGELELDQGEIHHANHISIGYLAQTTFDDESLSVSQALEQVFAPLEQMKQKLDVLTEKMATDYSEEVLERYAQLETQYESAGGYTWHSELMTVVTKFGFSEDQMQRPISSFSGGQKTRLAFVKLLLSKPDILLLDEPTNHLDLETIEWLEGYLKYYSKAVVLVSHDRMFLDHIAEEIYEIEFGSMKHYVGNYSSFTVQKQQDQARLQQAYDHQQKEIDRLEGLIEKFRYKASKAAFAQSKIKYLDRTEKLDAPQRSDTKAFSAHFTPRLKGGKTVLEIKDLVIGYNQPLCQVNLTLMAGQKVAIIGGNGCGKSTLMKTLVGDVEKLSGDFLTGHQIEVGYFDQQLAMFQSGKTVLEELWDDFPELDRTQVRTVLGSFLFTSEDVFKTVDILSGGEKVRLSLAKLMLKRSNFLLLDEPTNHLDIVGKEALEEALHGYTGTILFVSHDRYFIQKIATAILFIDQGKVTYYPYGYQQFEEGVQATQEQIAAAKKPVEQANQSPRRNPNAKEAAKLEKMISTKEEELENLREQRYNPDFYHDYQKMNELNSQIDDLHNDIEHLMARWEECLEG